MPVCHVSIAANLLAIGWPQCFAGARPARCKALASSVQNADFIVLQKLRCDVMVNDKCLL
jgi:hypothetical protein